MSRDSQTQPNIGMMLGGANMLGLAAISAYSIKNFNEIYAYLEEIKEELQSLRSSQVETGRLSTNAISRLNDKINAVQKKELSNQFKDTFAQKLKETIERNVKVEEKKIEEIEEDEHVPESVDDVTSAIADLMS